MATFEKLFVEQFNFSGSKSYQCKFVMSRIYLDKNLLVPRHVKEENVTGEAIQFFLEVNHTRASLSCLGYICTKT